MVIWENPTTPRADLWKRRKYVLLTIFHHLLYCCSKLSGKHCNVVTQIDVQGGVLFGLLGFLFVLLAHPWKYKRNRLNRMIVYTSYVCWASLLMKFVNLAVRPRFAYFSLCWCFPLAICLEVFTLCSTFFGYIFYNGLKQVSYLCFLLQNCYLRSNFNCFKFSTTVKASMSYQLLQRIGHC